MGNAAVILTKLDEHLDHSVRLVLYGRASLQLGFSNPPPDAANSQDVDCIIPSSDLDSLNADMGFWDAQEAANEALKSQGLYITHLFRDDQVFLRQSWEKHILPVTLPELKWLRLFRPATVDLILTKMMRGDDAQDMADAAFMIRHDCITEAQLTKAFEEMKPIELVELRDAFAKAKPVVLKLAREISKL
jgi:hypothetical protein